MIELAHLSETQRRAYMLADNQLALNAGWDTDLLALELGELSDSASTSPTLGFEAAELDALLDHHAPDPARRDAGAAGDTGFPPGDLWLLGPHRLLCGSSTEPATWSGCWAA